MMGVDCWVRLSPSAQVRDVATAIAILDGVQPHKSPLGTESGAWSCKSDVNVTGIVSMPECCHIDWRTDDGPKRTLYHFEGTGNWRLVSWRSRAWAIAIGKRLVDLFGGHVDYNDCDDVDADYSVPVKSHEEIAPHDGEPWQAWQEKLFNLKPLTREEIGACEPFASYPS